MAYIYILTNKINNKKYVGQTVQSLKKRLEEYRYVIKKSHRCIISAIKKYGWENFDIQYFIIPENLLDYFEVELIKRLNTLSPDGYNLETGGNKNKHFSEELKLKMGNAHSGFRHTEETKRKLSELNKGKKLSEEHKVKIGNKSRGRKHSEETKKKLSDFNKGRKDSPEIIKKRALSLINKPRSEEVKNKISKSKMGHIVSDETRSKISNAQKGKKRSEDFRQKISKLKKGVPLTEQHKLRIIESKKKKVICLETREIFNSITEAENVLNIKHISDCCRRTRKIAGGYHWMYYEDYLKTKQEAS